jgi:hypothetical protein
MIQAAVGGQGVAMGIGRLVSGLMASGQLAAPFCASTVGSRAYFIIRSALTGERPHVRAFVDWLIAEARTALEVEEAACCSEQACTPEACQDLELGGCRPPGQSVPFSPASSGGR